MKHAFDQESKYNSRKKKIYLRPRKIRIKKKDIITGSRPKKSDSREKEREDAYDKKREKTR